MSTRSLLKSVNNIDSFSIKSINRRGIEKLDFLLILIESIEINGIYSMISTIKDSGLEVEFSDSVDLWKARAHNPLRKASRRGNLTKSKALFLIPIISKTADRLYPLLRQLLSKKEPPEISKKRWELLNNRFNELISERMNLKRVAIQKILKIDENHTFIKDLVFLLALSSGQEGIRRLSTTINDINY